MSDDSLESDDECGFLRKALDVDLPEDFNPNSIPQNGLEYLHHVIYERNKCEKLVISNIDPNKFRNNQTFHVSLKTVQQTSERFIPSNEWQNNKLEDFKYFKRFVNKQNTPEPSTSVFKEDDFMKKIHKETPIFSEFVKYSQSAKIRMLQLISKYLHSLVQGESIEDNVGTWIFAILVMLEIPLSPSSCHVIREFARICLDIRSKLPDDADDRLFGPLNFNICICGRYFGQLDLSD